MIFFSEHRDRNGRVAKEVWQWERGNCRVAAGVRQWEHDDGSQATGSWGRDFWYSVLIQS